MSLHVMVIGLNHCTAPVEVREKIAFSGERQVQVIGILLNTPEVEEAMILSTCNRAEVVVTSNDPLSAKSLIINTIGNVHGLDPASFDQHIYVKIDSDAVRHLFRVTSSLDSMVLGEPQILGQVKESFRTATSNNSTGPVLNRLLHRAFFTAKRVRSETGIGRAAVSVAYAAVELAEKILGDLSAKTVLLVGAGEMAELAARHLLSQVEKPIVIANRTYQNACALATELCGSAISLDELDSGLEEADVVITSTGSCDPIITKRLMKPIMRRRRFRPVFLIDIAIPRDVEPAVNDLEEVYVYNIDDLQSVVQENLGERQQEALKGERIVQDEVGKFMAWTESLQAAPTIVALKDRLEAIRSYEMAKLDGKLSRMTSDDREAIEIITRQLINKIAHDPIVFLKKAGASAKRNVYLDVAQRMFSLNGLSQDRDKGERESQET